MKTVAQFIDWIGEREFTAGDISTFTGMDRTTAETAVRSMAQLGRIEMAKRSRGRGGAPSIFRVKPPE